MKRILREIFTLFREVIIGYEQVGGAMLAAALSYYTIFSLSPLLILATSLVGMIYSRKAVVDGLIHEVNATVGPRAAEALLAVFEAATPDTDDFGPATVISLVLMLIFSSLMFSRLKRAINLLWGIGIQPGQASLVFIRTHVLSFLMVWVVILLMLGFMVISTTLVSLNHWLSIEIPNAAPLISGSNFVLTILGFWALFAIIYKTLPDAHMAWRDVLLGAAFTSVLFTLGEYVIGYYLGRVSLRGAYGASSSIVIILAWIYYSMQIVLFGAKVTQVASNRYGHKLSPRDLSKRRTRSAQKNAQPDLAAAPSDPSPSALPADKTTVQAGAESFAVPDKSIDAKPRS